MRKQKRGTDGRRMLVSDLRKSVTYVGPPLSEGMGSGEGLAAQAIRARIEREERYGLISAESVVLEKQ